jgi:hypothetical protein
MGGTAIEGVKGRRRETSEAKGSARNSCSEGSTQSFTADLWNTRVEEICVWYDEDDRQG